MGNYDCIFLYEPLGNIFIGILLKLDIILKFQSLFPAGSVSGQI